MRISVVTKGSVFLVPGRSQTQGTPRHCLLLLMGCEILFLSGFLDQLVVLNAAMVRLQMGSKPGMVAVRVRGKRRFAALANFRH